MSRRSRDGQSLIESCLVIGMLSLILLGVFQVSQLLAAKEVLTYAASRGLRAKSVGFNRFMVYKVVRVGSIPAAGVMTTPQYAGGPDAAGALERPAVPLYLGAENWNELDGILDYERWDTIENLPAYSTPGGMIAMTVRQDYPLRMAFHEAFYAAESVQLDSDEDGSAIELDNHYPLYIDDAGL